MGKDNKKGSKKFMAAALLAGCFFLVLAFLFRGERYSDRFMVPGKPSPEFFLQDRTGRMVSSVELKGSVWVADFIFTHCAGSCPLLGREMAALAKQWVNDPTFKLASFTVDPDRDTVEVLHKYADDFMVEDTKWCFLTGKKEDLYRVIRQGFLENVSENKEAERGYEFIHSSKIALVDRDGLIRGFYDIERDGDTQLLRQDIHYLLNKQPAPPPGGGFSFRPGNPQITFIIPKPH